MKIQNWLLIGIIVLVVVIAGFGVSRLTSQSILGLEQNYALGTVVSFDAVATNTANNVVGGSPCTADVYVNGAKVKSGVSLTGSCLGVPCVSVPYTPSAVGSYTVYATYHCASSHSVGSSGNLGVLDFTDPMKYSFNVVAPVPVVVSHAYKGCYAQNVYWFNNLGVREDEVVACSISSPCSTANSGAVCTALVSPSAPVVSHYVEKCYNGNVYWYDSLGALNTKATTCASGQTCINAQCVTGTVPLTCTPNSVRTATCNANSFVEQVCNSDGKSYSNRVTLCNPDLQTCDSQAGCIDNAPEYKTCYSCNGANVVTQDALKTDSCPTGYSESKQVCTAKVCDVKNLCDGTSVVRTNSDCTTTTTPCTVVAGATGYGCSDGSCTMPDNSTPVDLCSGVSCVSGCTADGTFRDGGSCDATTGTCNYATDVPNSNQCVVTPTFFDKYGLWIAGIILVGLLITYIVMKTKKQNKKRK